MRNLLLSTVTFLVVPAVAIAAPNFSSHTHTTPIELKPISSSSGIKLAGVCFLGVGDCGDGGYGSIDGDGGYTMDTAQQCKNEGFSSSCSDGWRPLIGGNCPYNPNYVTCCQSSCPTNSSPDCTGEEVADDGCGYRCKQCCDDTCPSGSKDYTGSYASTTECGNSCYNCDTSCPSGSKTSYTGTSVGTNECGQSCKKCNSSCPSGYTSSPTSECYDTTTNECGNTCYKEKDCDPCAGYYECGGTWQYCEGSTCYADSSRCSTYCESDHFPYSCGSDYGPCYGDYRSGYCSVPCDEIDPCENVSGISCSHGCASYGSCGECISCSSDPCEGVSGVSCEHGCASYGSCGECTSCNGDPCAGVSGVSCDHGCASYGSCGECTSCNGNPDCDVSSLSCGSLGCKTTNSCGKCTECNSDPCAGVTGVNCPGGCASYGSCGQCVECAPVSYSWESSATINGELCTVSCTCSFPGGGYYSSCCSIDYCL